MALVKKTICLAITFGLLGCTPAIVGQLAQVSEPINANNQEFDLDLSSVSYFDTATIRIENLGQSSVVMPEIDGSGQAPITNSAAVVAWLRVQSNGTDRSLADAAWRYVTDHMDAYCLAGSRFDGPYAAGSPWVIFRGYGFGCCTQSSLDLAWLWHQVGLESRAAWWTGHAVAEVSYGGAWHMYDPDHRVYYTTSDGTVANVAMVVADPSLVASGADSNGLDPVGWTTAQMEALYTNADVTYGEYDPWFAEPGYNLAPGETLYLNSENSVSDVIYRTLDGAWGIGAPAVSSATLVHPVTFSDPQWQSRIYSLAGMDVTTTSLGTVLTTTLPVGTLIFHKEWPAPAFDMQLDGVFYRRGNADVILVYFSSDGLSWSSPDKIIVPTGSLQPASVALTNLARGAYSTYVKVEASGAPGDISIASLKLTTNVQASKKAFPALVAGTNNRLIYRDASPDTQSRQLAVSASVNQFPAAPVGMKVAKSQDETVGLEATVGELEGFLRAPLTFYPWLAYGGSTASQELWQEQQSGSVLQAVAANASNYLVMGAAVSWDHSDDGPTTWAVAKREPASLNFDWLEAPQSTNWFGAMTLAISSPGDQLILSTSHGGKVDLLGRPIYQKVTTTSLVAEDPIYSIAAGYGAAHLTDGNLRSLAYPGSPQFDYEMDLGGVAHVSAVGLNWGYFGTNPLFIQSWTLYGRRSQMDAWQVLQQAGFPGKETTTAELDTEVSQLRIAATSSHWIGMFEVSVAASVPLALSATSNVAEMTGVQSYGPASRLVDGNDNTLAYPGSIYNDYTLDPGSSSYIDEVRIVWGYFGSDARYVKSWRLYGQKQIGTTWDIITGGGSPNASISVIPVHNDYRRLRIAADGINWIGIYELEAYGTYLR